MSEPYPDLQIEALAALLNHLVARLPGLEGITGHEDLDTTMVTSEDQPGAKVRRKLDPGPLFPWPVLMDKILLGRLTAGDL